MREIRLVAITIALTAFAMAACETSEIQSDNTIEGTYVGTLTDNNGLEGRSFAKTIKDATAEITKIGNETIEVHLFDVELDTTFMLNYYEQRDAVMVCFTGDDFENMYGHMLGQGHMDGGMMNDMQNDETEWNHHLNDEHQDDDEHFGGFDMQNHSFGYQINMKDGGIPYILQFQGKKY